MKKRACEQCGEAWADHKITQDVDGNLEWVCKK